MTIVDCYGRINTLGPTTVVLARRLASRAEALVGRGDWGSFDPDFAAARKLLSAPRGLRPRGLVHALRREMPYFAAVVVAAELGVSL